MVLSYRLQNISNNNNNNNVMCLNDLGERSCD